VDSIYPRYRQMFKMMRDNEVLNVDEEEAEDEAEDDHKNDQEDDQEDEDVLLLLPSSTAESSLADQEHAMGSSDDDDDDDPAAVTSWINAADDDRPGALLDPDHWRYRDETIRSMYACFHVMEVPRERPPIP
jgi:hypothetical protein